MSDKLQFVVCGGIRNRLNLSYSRHNSTPRQTEVYRTLAALLEVAVFTKVKTVPPPSRFSHFICASIKPALARMFAKPRPSEFGLWRLNAQPLSSSLREKSPAADVVTNIVTSVALAWRQILFTA